MNAVICLTAAFVIAPGGRTQGQASTILGGYGKPTGSHSPRNRAIQDVCYSGRQQISAAIRLADDSHADVEAAHLVCASQKPGASDLAEVCFFLACHAKSPRDCQNGVGMFD